MHLSYFQAPATALDNAEEAAHWARLAFAAALRARAAKNAKASKKRKTRP